MQIVSGFLAAVGFVGTMFGIVNWYSSYGGTAKRRNSIFLTIIAAIIFLTFLFGYLLPASGNNSSVAQNNSASTSQNNTTPSNGITPTTVITPTPTNSPTPTATPSPTKPLFPQPGDVLFTAKFDGSQAWVGDSSWHVYGNALHTSGAGTILVPYKVQPRTAGTPNFMVKFQATQEGDGSFGVGIRVNDDGSGGYIIGPTGYDINQQHWIRIKGTNPWKETPFDPGRTSHTYETTVINDHITVNVDGAILLQADDGTYPSGENITLYSENVTFYVTSLQIIQE